MADPLSATASSIAIITACIQTISSLYDAVQRFKGRDKTLSRLNDVLEDMISTLPALEQIAAADNTTQMLLNGPVTRCTQICREFEVAMEKFKNKSKLSFVDWARMEFMGSDINDFMDVLANYKSTIAIGLAIISLQITKASNGVLDEFHDMVKTTSYDLKLQLQRIDERLPRDEKNNSEKSSLVVDLKDEKSVTEHCLQICEKAKAYLESVQKQEAPFLRASNAASSEIALQFAAQLRTERALHDSRANFGKIIHGLHEQLSAIMDQSDPDRSRKRAQLQDDINATKQCLEICDQASENVTRLKIHNIGPVVAEDDTDQVVVTTLADLFNVDKVQARDRSSQLVGSMTEDNLNQLSKDRYGSRFAAVSRNDDVKVLDGRKPSKVSINPQQRNKDNVVPLQRDDNDRPSANEMRRRKTDSSTS